MDKKEKFIEKAIKRHGNRYDYSKVEYTDSLTKVCIICPEHGEFWQTPQSHIRGYNCPKCSNRKRGDTFRGNGDDFIARAKEVHGDKYSYEKVHYVNAMTKVIITCPKHGDFEMTPANHLNGQGCPKCAGRGLSQDEVIERFREKHGAKYDYSKVIYTKMHEKVCIICPEHGEFWQTPSKHILGQECPKCAAMKRSENKTLSRDEFIEKANKVHNGKYDYSKSVYRGTYDAMTITCPIHGDFKQRANYHLNGHGCPVCGNNMSIGEAEISDFIKSLGFSVHEKDRSVLDGDEIDILIPEKGIGIEYDGLYWHSDEYKSPEYHLGKTVRCLEKGIRLIHVFEDEWNCKKDIVKSMLKSVLGVTDRKIYARKCEIRPIDSKEKSLFLNENHIQGNVSSKINLGLFYDGELVAAMCFGEKRVNLGARNKTDGEYELLRFCNRLDTTVVGGASRLLNHFINEFQPSRIISYCDRRWSSGNMYEKLGFVKSHESRPNYFYIQGNNRKNRFKYRKSELVKEGFDRNKSESEIMKERGIHRIYDCGTMVYAKHLS